ncbi:MAG: tRNA (adenosine(37)-N6)-threonylcarbamoyltransferase complex ATPase subunit type 1 TsaE [Candidatus Paceibacterota bacterium]|jgi:tRNA threonylcarbamoyladenosine biosynthesis protein TsaE
MEILSNSLEQTEKIAKDFIKKILAEKRDKALVVGLHGDLGSGKTTFVQLVAKNLGIKETITSPTFVILKNYTLNAKPCEKNSSEEFSPVKAISQGKPYTLLVHIDAYRLENGEELEKLGWREIINNPENLVLIEWPELVKDVLPKDIFEIKFKFIDETTRSIEYSTQ